LDRQLNADSQSGVSTKNRIIAKIGSANGVNATARLHRLLPSQHPSPATARRETERCRH
jgi:hypothetical protein